MAISSLDTHEIVKDLKGAGFTDKQAEAVTRAVKKRRTSIYLTWRTKTDLAEPRAELIKWVVGAGFAQVAMILAVLRLFPGANP
jgi:hypothetical protein